MIHAGRTVRVVPRLELDVHDPVGHGGIVCGAVADFDGFQGLQRSSRARTRFLFMPAALWLLEGDIKVGPEWCRLGIFAESRSDFRGKAEQLPFALPKGWRRATMPMSSATHSCGRDALPHLAPMELAGTWLVEASDVIEQLLTDTLSWRPGVPDPAQVLIDEIWRRHIRTCTILRDGISTLHA